MKIKPLIDFLNTVDPQQLNESLDELEKEVQQIFTRTNSLIDPIIIEEIKRMNEKLFVWFCFLRANFLRGKDTISNKAFKQFIDFCKRENNNYYFYEFATQNFLPQFNNPKFRQAKGIENVLQDLRRNYASGSEFVDDIENIISSFEIQEIHSLYLELIAKLMSIKGIGSKIANAVLNEVPVQLNLLKKYNEDKKFQDFLNNEFIRKLVQSSTFNVMIDTHVRKFFEEKLSIKNVEQSILILISKNIKNEIIELLFKKYFYFIEKKIYLLKNIVIT
jgi:ribosomal protein S13